MENYFPDKITVETVIDGGWTADANWEVVSIHYTFNFPESSLKTMDRSYVRHKKTDRDGKRICSCCKEEQSIKNFAGSAKMLCDTKEWDDCCQVCYVR